MSHNSAVCVWGLQPQGGLPLGIRPSLLTASLICAILWGSLLLELREWLMSGLVLILCCASDPELPSVPGMVSSMSVWEVQAAGEMTLRVSAWGYWERWGHVRMSTGLLPDTDVI